MLYIKIPAGMTFRSIVVLDHTDDKSQNQLEDHFVSLREERSPISIQKLVKTFYTLHATQANIDGIMCYKKNPPLDKPILVYRANRNGTCPSDYAVVKEPAEKNHASSSTSHASWWANNAFISEDRRARLEEKRYNQRHNRRHDGDSPMPT